jgi:hypothetical protein
MTTEDLKGQLKQIPFKKITFGYNELNLAKQDDFDKWQEGYRHKAGGENLISETEGHWQDDWYVIATDSIGDPHFVDIKQDKVFTAVHGEGEWYPVPIADNLAHYIEILDTLKGFSSGRETPEKLEKNPLSGEQMDELMDILHSKTEEDEEYHYWEYWLDE